MTDNAYKTMIKNKVAYFCNEEHCLNYNFEIEKIKKEKEAERTAKKELASKIKAEKEEKKKERIEKYKEDKNKVYRLVCEIIGKKEIINTLLWKEWAIWNMVASNEVIGQYLEENKTFLTSTISRLDNVEHGRIRYFSAILKNNLGDYKPNTKETEKPKIQVDDTFYIPTTTRSNRRRALADLEDEF